MLSAHEQLARSLEALQALQQAGHAAIRSNAISRTHRERLVAAGFLEEVMRGWYIARPPELPKGETTPWYTNYWGFCADYLDHRFGAEWSLSAEQSIRLHAGDRGVPRQLVVRAPKASNNVVALPHETSLLDLAATLPSPNRRARVDGLRIYTLPAAIVAAGPTVFERSAVDLKVALSSVRDASALLSILLEGGHSTIAGRVAGGLRQVGRGDLADEIIATMRGAGFVVAEVTAFESPIEALRARSPWARRVEVLWATLREPIVSRFEAPPPIDDAIYLGLVDEAYGADAYNSLSIEGYRVDDALVARVRGGGWSPEVNDDARDALAARGYWEAYRKVREGVGEALAGAPPGAIVENSLRDWYRALFLPSVRAGLLEPASLAGYRTGPVYIRGSMHVPPRSDALVDGMSALFDCLAREPSAAVRAVLGHFFVGHLHPFPDGNGRVARFVMNVMFASGGYPWTIVPVGRRVEYLAALEKASVDGDIVPFADFIAGLAKPEAL